MTLKHIKDTNKALEGEKEPTINRVLERLFINHELLDNFISDPKNCRERYGVSFAKTLKIDLLDTIFRIRNEVIKKFMFYKESFKNSVYSWLFLAL